MFDFDNFNDKQLSEELKDTEEDITYYQEAIKRNKNMVNRYMEYRESLIEEMKRRGKSRGR